MIKRITLPAFLAISCIAFYGCASGPPADAFVVGAAQLERRSVETRVYNGIAESSLIAASANVLQDMGFQTESVDEKLGVLTASKDRDATNTGEVVLAIFVALLGGGVTPIDDSQKIKVTVVTKPLYDGPNWKRPNSWGVRATFNRVVIKTDKSMRVETLSDPKLYQGFFAQLDKSIFLEGQQL